MSTIDLIPKGSEVKVTRENCRDYVKYYLQYLFHESVKKQFEAFRRGFMKVCNGRVIVSVEYAYSSACLYINVNFFDMINILRGWFLNYGYIITLF